MYADTFNIPRFFFIVIIQNEPDLLEEFGGHIKLNVSWAKSFLKRIDAAKMTLNPKPTDTTKLTKDC